MEKTIKKLCLMLAMFDLVRMSDAMTIGSKGRWKNQLRDKLIIFFKKLKKINRVNYQSWIISIRNEHIF